MEIEEIKKLASEDPAKKVKSAIKKNKMNKKEIKAFKNNNNVQIKKEEINKEEINENNNNDLFIDDKEEHDEYIKNRNASLSNKKEMYLKNISITRNQIINDSTYTLDQLFKMFVIPNLDLIEFLAYKGCSLEQIAKEIGVSGKQLYLMRKAGNEKKYKELNEALDCDEKIRLKNVENNLYRMAMGYTYTEEQIIPTKFNFIDKKGKKVERQELRKKLVTKTVDPNFNALRFYLINKDREHWKSENYVSELQNDVEKVLIVNDLKTSKDDDIKLDIIDNDEKDKNNIIDETKTNDKKESE